MDSGVFRNLKGGVQGYILDVLFQKCSKFSVFFHIEQIY